MFVVQWLEAEGRMWLCGFERTTVCYNAHNRYEVQTLQHVAGLARTI